MKIPHLILSLQGIETQLLFPIPNIVITSIVTIIVAIVISVIVLVWFLKIRFPKSVRLDSQRKN